MRGLKYDPLARAFLEEFPIDSLLSTEEFDTWAFTRGLLVPPANVERSSPEWLKHVAARDLLKSRLNRAALHPRMFEDHGLETFMIVAGGKGRQGVWRVVAPHDGISEHIEMDASISSFLAKRRRLRYQIEALNRTQLPRHIVRRAQDLLTDVDMIHGTFAMQTTAYNRKCDRLSEDIDEWRRSHGLSGPRPSGGLMDEEPEESLPPINA